MRSRIISLILAVMTVSFCVFPLFAEESAAYAEEGSSQNYVRTIFNEQSGLPTGEANTILQTSDGYLWIGSYGGLIRYDGSRFRNYSTDGSISSSSIRSLFEDSSGRLWIGTNDAGVYVFENGAFDLIESPGDYSFLCVRDFAEGPDGTVYVASTSGMGEIDGGKLLVYDDDPIFAETVYSIACDPSGNVWASLNGGKCVVVSDRKVQRTIESSEIFPDADIYCVESDGKGRMYIGSSADELAVLTFDESGGYTKEIFPTDCAETHNNIKISFDGRVIVCGEHGFAVLDESGNIVMRDDTNTTIPTNDAVIDYEGNLWLASSTHGAIRYSIGSIDTFGENTEISDTALNAVTVAGGDVYAVHDNGMSIITADGKTKTNELTKMLSGVRIRHAMTDSRGNVWLSTYSEHGAVRYDPSSGEITQFRPDDGLVSDRVRETMELSDGSVAVATQEGVNIIKDDKVTESYTADDGLEVTAILCLAQDGDGTLYMGSDGGGVYSLSDGVITSHGFEEGLDEGVVLRMIPDSDGGGYFISAGSNLYYWDKTTFTKLENFMKGAGSIFDFFDKDGKLWLLQNNGIIALDKDKLLGGAKNVPETTYSFESGLSGSLNANTWNYLSPDGTLYISTRQGINTFDFTETAPPLPKITLNSAAVDDESFERPGELDIPAGARRVTLDFSALSFSGKSNFEIEYKLEGFDDTATKLTNTLSDTVSYTNLPGGNYKFTVKIYYPEHPETANTCTIDLVKAKQFYEYPLFWVIAIALLVLLGISVTYIIVSARLRAARRRQEEYRRIVEQSLRTFAETIDAKDKYTTGHSLRVASYSRELARRMGMPASEQERIYYIALLHDIGKIGVPDSILTKPGKLTDEEMEIIRTHPAIGGKILENFTAIRGISQGARYHHERYDGTGYCERKAGKDIPLEARIIGVADTYDAMSSTRCYRKALSREYIIDELKRVSGTQLDPEIVPHMLDMIDEGFAPLETVSELREILDENTENQRSRAKKDASRDRS